MEKLTPRQAQILKLIRRFVATHGFPPTRAEIAEKLGFRSPNAAEDHLRALERKKAIRLLSGASRGIQVLGGDKAGLPLVTRVSAGKPVLDHVERHCEIDANQFDPPADFLLQVRGSAMQDAGILNGDLLAVHASPEASTGQVVVARYQDELLVRRIRRRRNQVQLDAEGKGGKRIEVDLRDGSLVIEGIGVGLLRTAFV
ncbi:MAG: transcriptional repressor LexA [Gammaproteobacteria bacterium]